jgi:RNA polymerase sigma factor (sigma-70 family)
MVKPWFKSIDILFGFARRRVFTAELKMTESHHLLAEYVRTGSETAFRDLVARYVDLVYSTALRLVEGDGHRAEDVAQTVFADLAREARTLAAEVMLGGWLHRHTCFVAANTMRGERRRQSRERQAVEMNALQDNSGADFSLIAPILDEAINELAEEDRTAVLLRFFEQRDFRSVGEVLGSSEDAARMRVNRALEKLHSLLKRRGVTTSAAILGVTLSANALQAAPAGLATMISSAATLAATAVSTSTAFAATKVIAMTTLQKTLVTATVAVLAGAGIYEARQASALRTQFETVQQQTPLTEQIQQLQRERDEAARQLAALREENDQLTHNTAELLRLRGEVGALRRQVAAAANAKPQPTARTEAAAEPADALEQQKRMQLVKLLDGKGYASQLVTFASANQGWLPTNWLQVAGYAKDFPVSESNSFEMIHRQPLNLNQLGTNFPNTIVVREFMAWPTHDGKWRKIYGYADGHAQAVEVTDGNFTAWEEQNTYNPEAASR